MVVFEDDNFMVSPCRSCNIPGYLIVECKDAISSLSQLSVDAQKDLGVLLALLESAVTKTLSPEQVYCARFGESGGNLHFHVFPRSTVVTEQYLEYFPTQEALIHGPILFDWAREYYKVETKTLSQEVIVAADSVIDYLATT
ncbi:HIT family protein [Vibrio parahaemolyticus]